MELKLSDMTQVQMPKCSLGGLALGISPVSGIDDAKPIGETDNLEHVTQPCCLPPNLSVITQLSLELCQAMCRQGSCRLKQRMWTLTILSPASGEG